MTIACVVCVVYWGCIEGVGVLPHYPSEGQYIMFGEVIDFRLFHIFKVQEEFQFSSCCFVPAVSSVQFRRGIFNVQKRKMVGVVYSLSPWPMGKHGGCCIASLPGRWWVLYGLSPWPMGKHL